MLLLLEFPNIVKKYAPNFRSCFSKEGYEHFQKALSGFMVSENKTLTAINELFVLSPRHQSSFNRFFNRQPFDLELLHKCRLDMLQSNSQTKLKDDGFTSTKGVLSVDNSLLKHYGKHFHNIYYHYDYVHKCYRWSHDLVTLYYSDNQTDYPISYQLWEPPDWDAVATFFKTKDFTINKEKWENRHKSGTDAQKWRNYIRARYRAGRKKHPAVVEIYQTKNHIAAKLIKKFCEQYPDKNLPIALDTGFTSAELCEQITIEFKRDYVGALREDQYIEVKGEEMLIKTLISQLKKKHTDPESSTFSKQFKKVGYHYKGRKETCYAYIGNFRIRNFKKKQRVVISFLKKDLKDRPNITISNRTDWNDSTILRIRRHRWPVETFHQEGKAEGLEKYQVRNDKAIQTYIALLVTAFSMLKCSLHDAELLSVPIAIGIQQQFQTKFDDGANHKIKVVKASTSSLPAVRKLMKIESLMNVMEYVFIQFNKGHSLEQTFNTLTHSLFKTT